MIRLATDLDVPELLELAEIFVEESGYDLTFNRHNSQESFWGAIDSPFCDVLVSEGKGLVAWAIMVYENEHHDETCAYIQKFHVRPDCRGTEVARDLVEACLGLAKARGARYVFAAATAGMGGRVEQQFVNLFKKKGFRVLGRSLVNG